MGALTGQPAVATHPAPVPDQVDQNALAFSGLSPQMLAMFASANQGGQPSAAEQQLMAESAALAPDPTQVKGALSQAQNMYDEASQAKMDAMRRAIAALQAAANPPGDLARFRAANAMLAPTRTGRFGESLANSGNAYADEIEKQRAIERQVAEQTSNLDIGIPEVQQQQSAQDVGFVEKPLQMSGQLANQAAMAGYRRGMIDTRNASIMERMTAAQLNAKKGQIQFIGNDPTDQKTGVYLDKTTGQVTYGPPAKSSSALTDAQHWADTVTAQERVITNSVQGMNMTPQQVHDTAVQLAGQSLAGAPAGGGAGGPAPAPAPAPAAAATLPALKDRVPGKTTWSPDGGKTVFTWTTKGWVPKGQS